MRIAFTDETIELTGMRWYYGTVCRVSPELLDVKLDNGEMVEKSPLFDVKKAS